ncbi:hypothetical protein SAMN06295885_2089 [Rathayibacter oskolensis]|uniref:Transmembrane secretion effector n=1 Tax=Rathayibacter oskolensis TaxID=1891671 RepID=A0A1X7NWW6_9MICO|nr:hypothetical protein [Rathayibacter oskolensis]SMH42893.1 hypothetical protein SAMN06295885_2089 [Rathayibacter oskolensis]
MPLDATPERHSLRAPVGAREAGLATAFLVANSQAVSLRQLATAPDLRGRVNAAYRFISWGAIAGGALATLLGPWQAALIGAALMAAATLPVALSPVRSMTTLEPH